MYALHVARKVPMGPRACVLSVAQMADFGFFGLVWVNVPDSRPTLGLHEVILQGPCILTLFLVLFGVVSRKEVILRMPVVLVRVVEDEGWAVSKVVEGRDIVKFSNARICSVVF